MSLALEANNLRIDLTYPALDLNANSGSLTLVLGPTGSAKSQLMKTLAGVIPTQAGEVAIYGQDPYAGDEKQWLTKRKDIGFILPRRSLISHLTVLQNIMLPLSYHRLAAAEEVQGEALAMIKLIGIQGDINKLPAQFSESEQRLITIARALVLKPKILFIDQAFANLDARLRQRFIQIFKQIMATTDITLILSSRDLLAAAALSKVIPTAQQIIFLAEQEIFQFSTWHQLEQSNNRQITEYAQLHHSALEPRATEPE